MPVIATVRVATGSAQSLHALPVAASALDRFTVANSSAYTADGLLRSLPGFDRTRSNSMFTNYGQLRVSFAGAGNDRGLVLADGIPAQDGFGGQVDWAAYPVSDIQRAELLMGAGSALYGAGAIGGVLDLQTFAPAARTVLPSGTLSIGAGGHAYSDLWSNTAASIAPRLNASVALQQQRLEYFALPPNYASPIARISQADASMASVRLRYAAGDRDAIDVEQRGAWDDQFEGRPNYTFSRHLAQTGARYSHSTPQSALQATLYSRVTHVENLADQYPAKPGVLRYVQDVPTNESGASLQWTIAGGASTFQVRADARHTGGVSSQYGAGAALQSAGSGLQNTGGIAAEQTWRSGRFELLGGARFDTVRSYGEQLVSVSKGATTVTLPPESTNQAISPRLAVRYDLSPRLALRASSAAGLRAPFLNELVRGFFIGNVAFLPNPALVPERTHTSSAGIDYVDARSHLSLDAFDTTVNDAIMFRTIDPTHEVRSNIARTQTDAYVVNYTRALGSCSRISAWFSNQNARVQAGPAAIVGKRLQYVPAQSGSVDYGARIGALDAGVSLSYLGQTYADDLNTQPLGSAVLAGAHLRIPLADGAAIELQANNLTDARYLSSIDRYGPPALISVAVAMPLGRNAAESNACLP